MAEEPVIVAGVGAEDNGDHDDHTEDQEDPEAEDGGQKPDLDHVVVSLGCRHAET